MSRIATDWAWSLDIKPASLKLLLLSMADRADEEHCCFPSIDRLVRDTGLNKKTVQQGLGELVARGLIADTGARRGPTMRVRVFCLVGVEKGVSNQPKNGIITKNGIIKNTHSNEPKIGNVTENGNIPENGTLNDPEIGVLNDPEIGVQNQSLEPPIEPTAVCSSETVLDSVDVSPPAAEEDHFVRLFNTSSPDHRFSMFADWQPSERIIELCQLNRVDLSKFDADEQAALLAEFVSYWMTTSEAAHSQGQWEHKFVKQLQRSASRVSESQNTKAGRRAVVSGAVMNIHDTNW